MKKSIVFLLVIASFQVLPSCIFVNDGDLFLDSVSGTGRVATEQRTVGFFDRISVLGSNNVSLVQGNEVQVEVSAYENLLPLLETYVEGGTLYIRYRPNTNVRNDNSLVRVRVPSLTGISVTGSGNVIAESAFNFGRLETIITGSGNISLFGTARSLNCRISGSGNLRAFDLLADEVNVAISGSGDASVNARLSLEVTISGSGDVIYQGNPVVNSRVSGSGRVRRR
jgi:Putative auto-transporter adhesin, head GIN domain